MSTLDNFLHRNQAFAEQQSKAGTHMPTLPEALPTVKAIVIGCADMRVDPVHVLGLTFGEAVVMRNIGGRVTPGLLQQLGLLGQIGAAEGAVPGGGGEFHIVVLHHTDCGITRLTKETAMLEQYFQVDEAGLSKKSVLDPRSAVTGDVAILRSVPGLPPNWLLSGLVYDVHTGKVEVIVPAAPIGASTPANA